MAQTVVSASRLTELAHCAAVLLPADPPRSTRIAFWLPDGDPPVSDLTDEETTQLTVALPDGDGGSGGDGTVVEHTVPALALPVADAVPVLTRARSLADGSAAAYWGAAAVTALQLAARGRLLPGVSPAERDAWRLGPLDETDVLRLRELAAAMPPHAHAAPLAGTAPPLLPEPEAQLRAFLDAVADGLPRTPAAALAAGGRAYAAPEAQQVPGQRDWAAEVAAGQDAGVRLSLRVEIPGLLQPPAGSADNSEAEDGASGSFRFRAVLQLHSRTDPTLVADAADVWAGGARAARFGSRARPDTLLALRRAAAVWEPLRPLLSAAVPDAVELADEEVTELLGAPLARALESAGVQVHWPRELARGLTARAVVSPPDDGRYPPEQHTSALPSLLSPDAVLTFSWQHTLGGHEVTRAELDRLAESGRPLVRLRDQWVLVDPDAVQRARKRQEHHIAPLDALRTVLTGSTVDEHGEETRVRAAGLLETLREQLAAPERIDHTTVTPPEGLTATLRDYQLRGLAWLERMTGLGLGGCLADDMGLGKTVTLIALHLRRQRQPGTAGPTLVVCPASLLGNWQREIERFAPGTPVRRHHGAARSLADLAQDEFVLTTYGTMRLDAARLGELPDRWGLVVADEAQHAKNPFSATARQLRTLPARARVALTGTPVENNLSELWSILDWTTPGLLGRLPEFRRDFADAVEGGGDPAAAEQLSRLVAPFLLRRHKADPGIAPELPPKTETDRAVALTPEQAGLYEAVVREGLAELSGADGFARRGLVVKLLTSLKQICNHPAQYLGEDPSAADGTNGPRLAGRSGKLELLDELLDELLAADAGVLVFTQYVQLARLLERHLAERGVPCRFLHGGTPVAERERMVRAFQEGEVPVFLLSLKAGGTGLNLTRAEHVVHFDRWWNPAVESQATDRAYRIGQDRPVQVHRLIAEGTVEDRIATMLARKQELADAVLGSGEAALTELTDAELADLIRLGGSHR